MSDKYLYDKDGDYVGHVSDDPPGAPNYADASGFFTDFTEGFAYGVLPGIIGMAVLMSALPDMLSFISPNVRVWVYIAGIAIGWGVIHAIRQKFDPC